MGQDDDVRLERALAECARLREENARLRQLLGEPDERRVIPSQPVLAERRGATAVGARAAVTMASPPEEKVTLFRSLFRGREDVYAIRWEGRNGRSGYSPACEWNPAVHSRQRRRRADPGDRKFFPLTDRVMRDHLLGRHTVGIYPLLLDETCRLLAADFDKKSWKDDALAFVETCRQLSVPAALERSRSGNGAHVWIFFDSAVHANTARKLGCHILTRTMERRYSMGLDSYDRFFPNQDTMPKGGFGNLIALPLQRVPRARGNSVFLDSSLQPHLDQWAFLSAIEKLSVDNAEALVREAARSGTVVGVRMSITGDDTADAPWRLPPSRRLADPAISGPLPDRIRIVRGNLIYVEKKELPPPLLNRLIRLAAFQNPEFYRAQAMRLSTFGKPRVIGCAEEFREHLGLPRGCLEEVRELLETHAIKAELTDERNAGIPIGVSFRGRLSAVQKKAAAAVLAHDDGILCAPTAFGKTVVAAWIIAERSVNTLVLVHRRQLMDQWVERLSSFLGLGSGEIGQIGGGKNTRTRRLDVGVIQGLSRKGEVKDLVAEYGHVVVDECHHVPAFTVERILRQVKAKYVVGLTATPVRKDGHHPILVMQCGPIRFSHSARKETATRALDHRVVPRYTDFKLPLELGDATIQEIYGAIARDEKRAELIVHDVLTAVEKGRSPIVLTERKGHLQILRGKLEGRVPNLLVLQGGAGEKERARLASALQSIPEQDPRVILATGRYVGEGFDDARLDTLFLAMPVSWRGTLLQYVGRLHRLHYGKRVAQVYDYIDGHIPMLMRMYERRLKAYRSIGYAVEEPPEAEELRRWAEVERTAVETAMAHEKARGFRVQSVQDGVEGFDLISRRIDPSDPSRVLEERFIEVKGRAGIGEIALTSNEYDAARRLRNDYWLYVVFNCTSTPELHTIQDPARLSWVPLTKIDQYRLEPEKILQVPEGETPLG
jgi:superfamily II DNA or RNA helicase